VSNELAGGSDASVLNNGLNVESVIKTDKNGNVTKDQFINVGDYFKLRSDRIPVVDVDEATNGVAFGTRSGIVWASAETLTEVK
ncbi:MAG: lytic exoenzyme target recognition domain-containing protein, partial [Leuconostoc mesenteroides]